MTKKKSKSQKQRKKLQKKRKLLNQSSSQVVNKKEVLYNVALTNPSIFKDIVNNKKTEEQKEDNIKKEKDIKIEKKIKNKFKIELPEVKSKTSKNKKNKKSLQKTNKKSFLVLFNEKINKKENHKNKNENKNVVKIEKKKIKEPKKPKVVIEKIEEETENKKIKHPVLVKINNVISLLFRCVLILTFIILLIGAIRVNVFTKKQILYAACLIGFLSLVALSYSKYFSGKLFIIILVVGMSYGIYNLQYTYDFIHNLNTEKYEYKTYYLVGFDTLQNINVYSVNSKKVGLLSDNNVNVQRKLNTVLNSVNYVVFDNEDKLYSALYKSEVRALILTENEYKFLQFDSRLHNDKNIKVLYEFKVNAHK